MTVERKKNCILEGINELFGDTSVPKKTTLHLLEEIQGELESKIDCLWADIKRESNG